LSPGERTRASLALLGARGVNCVVLDEPTNHLDLPAIEQLEAALAGYAGTLLVVTHDRELLDALDFTRCIELERGGIVDARTVATAAVRAVTSAASPPSLMLGTPPPHDAVATRRSRRSSTERSAAEALDVLATRTNRPPRYEVDTVQTRDILSRFGQIHGLESPYKSDTESTQCRSTPRSARRPAGSSSPPVKPCYRAPCGS